MFWTDILESGSLGNIGDVGISISISTHYIGGRGEAMARIAYSSLFLSSLGFYLQSIAWGMLGRSTRTSHVPLGLYLNGGVQSNEKGPELARS